MTQPEFEVKFNARVGEAIKDMVFPADKIPEGLRDYLLLSLPVFTYHAVKCTLNEFEACAEYAGNGGELSMTTAFIALQVCPCVTANDIGVNFAVYCQMNRHLDDMALQWDTMTKAIKDGVNAAINAEFEASQKLNTKAAKRIHLPN